MCVSVLGTDVDTLCDLLILSPGCKPEGLSQPSESQARCVDAGETQTESQVCVERALWESLGLRVPPGLMIFTSCSSPRTPCKGKAEPASCAHGCLHPPLFSSLQLLASLHFKFLLKSLFPKNGLIRFSGLRFNSLPLYSFSTEENHCHLRET